MRKLQRYIINVVLTFALIAGSVCQANNDKAKSFHFGFFYPNGVDLVGYTTESPLNPYVYWFYTFGIPSLAAAGLCLYQNYNGNGLVFTVGIGIGSVAYSSVALQWHIKNEHYVKLGGGVTTAVVYTGFYPALSYEIRY